MDRAAIQKLVTESIKKGDPSSWFETLYNQSNGDPTQVPWADLQPNRHLENWLKDHKGNSAKGLVIGCGLGDDAECMSKNGFHTTSFDVSTTAIAWCKKRFPDTKVQYKCENLFSPPQGWKRSFDLVFEAFTIQALPQDVRKKAIRSIAEFVAPKGQLLVVCTGQTTTKKIEGPPWPLTPSDLEEFSKFGLTLISLREENDGHEAFPLTFVGNYKRE